MKNMRQFIATVLVSIVGMFGLFYFAYAQIGGGVASPSFFKKSGSYIEVIDDSLTLKATGAEFENVLVGGAVDGSLKLKDDQLFILGDDDDVNIGFDSANGWLTTTADQMRFNSNCITIGKGSAHCTGDNSIAMGTFITTTEDNVMEVGFTTEPTMRVTENTFYAGRPDSSTWNYTGFDFFRGYGTNFVSEQTNFILAPSTGSAVTYKQMAFGAGANVGFLRANGDKITQTSIANGNRIGELYWGGYHALYGGDHYIKGAQINAWVDGAISGAAAEAPMRIDVWLVPDNSTALSKVWTWYSDGDVTHGSGVAGKDYSYTFDGETNDGVLTWMEDEAEFNFDSRIAHPGTFGEIHVHDASTAQSIATGASYTKLTAFTDNGESANMTPDATNDKITITKTGRYKIEYSMSFTAAITKWYGTMFLDGVEQNNIHFTRSITSATDVGNTGMVGIIDVTSVPVDLDVRIRHDSGSAQNITVQYANLNTYYLGET